jgi:Tfp pilus assembly protein FimT
MDTKRSSRTGQRGFSFFMLILVIALLAFIGAIGAQAFPTFMEYQAIRKAVDRSAGGGTPQEIRLAFEKAAAVDDIKSITGKDLEIKREGDRNVVRFAYNKEIHIWGPAFLLLKYTGQSK